MLTTERQINTAKQNSRAIVTAILVANSQVIDNEVIRVGLYRKLRRATLMNLDNNVVRFRFASQDAAGANDAALNLTRVMGPYGNAIIEPDKVTENILAILATTTVRRLSGYIEAVDGAITAGVEVNLEYYDDIGK